MSIGETFSAALFTSTTRPSHDGNRVSDPYRLRSTGACRAYFPAALSWPKCRACPLAAESALPPEVSFLLDPDAWDGGLEIRDHLPEEWEDG